MESLVLAANPHPCWAERENGKLRILVLLLAVPVFISVTEEKQAYEEFIQSPDGRIQNNEITGVEPFRAVVNLGFDFKTSNNNFFAIRAECYNPERTMFSIGSCKDALMEIQKLLGNNIINKTIPLSDKKTKKEEGPAIDKSFWFPLDRYHTEVNIGGVHFIKLTIGVEGFKYNIVSKWNKLKLSIKISLYRSPSTIFFLLVWWSIITGIGFIYAWQHPKVSKSWSEMRRDAVVYFLSMIGSIVAIRSLSAVPTTPTFLDFLFLVSFLVCFAITLWPLPGLVHKSSCGT